MTELSRFLPDDLKSSVVLRSPCVGDVEAMVRYFDSLGERSRAYFHPHPFDRDHAEMICRNAGPDTFRVVAESAGEIVGYAWFGPTSDSPYAIVGIGISDRFQGRGLGGALIDVLSHEARRRGLPGLRLTVYKENERAVRLYESRGYKVVGEQGQQHVMELIFGDGR